MPRRTAKLPEVDYLDEFEPFQDQIVADPGNETLWLVAADWLQDHDDPRAQRLRDAARGCRVLVAMRRVLLAREHCHPGGGGAPGVTSYEWWCRYGGQGLPTTTPLDLAMLPKYWWLKIECIPRHVYNGASKDYFTAFAAWLHAGEAFVKLTVKQQQSLERRYLWKPTRKSPKKKPRS